MKPVLPKLGGLGAIMNMVYSSHQHGIQVCTSYMLIPNMPEIDNKTLANILNVICVISFDVA